ncbi:MAG: diguanylate cyclase [Halochromatium sp.]
MSTARTLLDNAADKLPSPNGVALAIMELWEDEHATINQIAHLVQSDPALSGRLLRLANSASTGLRPVTSIPEAVVRIGLKSVGELAVAFSVIDVNHYDERCQAFDYQGFWSQCLLMALVSRELGRATCVAPPEELFTCALMMRIGILAFATIFPQAYSVLIETHPGDLGVAERQQFGFDHNDLSAEMLIDFGLPVALVEPAKFHEHSSKADFEERSRGAKLATLFHLAYQLSTTCLEKGIGEASQANRTKTLARRLDLPIDQLSKLLKQSVNEWQEWSKILDIPAAPLPPTDTPASEDDPAASSSPGGKLQALLIHAEGGDHALQSLLEARSIHVHACREQNEFLRLALQIQPQLIFIGEDAGIEKDRLCRLIRSTEWGKTVYLVSILDGYESEQVTQALSAGADTCIPEDIDEQALDAHLVVVRRFFDLQAKWEHDRAELRRIANELALSHRRMEVLSLTDQLTGLPNRRSAIEALGQAWSVSERSNLPMSVIMIDIDHFKRINDQFGHAAGDQVLADVAKALKADTRQGDSSYRMGGEEFLLLSSALDIKQIIVVAERLRRRIAALDIDCGGHRIQLSISLGAAQREAEHEHFDALLSAADKALYAAKSGGRNRVCFYHNKRIHSIDPNARDRNQTT